MAGTPSWTVSIPQTKHHEKLVRNFKINSSSALTKLINATNRQNILLKENIKSYTIFFSPAAYLLAKTVLRTILAKKGSINVRQGVDKGENIIDLCIHYSDNKVKFVVNMYNTTCKAMVNGSQYRAFKPFYEQLEAIIMTEANSLQQENVFIQESLLSKANDTNCKTNLNIHKNNVSPQNLKNLSSFSNIERAILPEIQDSSIQSQATHHPTNFNHDSAQTNNSSTPPRRHSHRRLKQKIIFTPSTPKKQKSRFMLTNSVSDRVTLQQPHSPTADDYNTCYKCLDQISGDTLLCCECQQFLHLACDSSITSDRFKQLENDNELQYTCPTCTLIADSSTNLDSTAVVGDSSPPIRAETPTTLSQPDIPQSGIRVSQLSSTSSTAGTPTYATGTNNIVPPQHSNMLVKVVPGSHQNPVERNLPRQQPNHITRTENTSAIDSITRSENTSTTDSITRSENTSAIDSIPHSVALYDQPIANTRESTNTSVILTTNTGLHLPPQAPTSAPPSSLPPTNVIPRTNNNSNQLSESQLQELQKKLRQKELSLKKWEADLKKQAAELKEVTKQLAGSRILIDRLEYELEQERHAKKLQEELILKLRADKNKMHTTSIPMDATSIPAPSQNNAQQNHQPCQSSEVEMLRHQLLRSEMDNIKTQNQSILNQLQQQQLLMIQQLPNRAYSQPYLYSYPVNSSYFTQGHNFPSSSGFHAANQHSHSRAHRGREHDKLHKNYTTKSSQNTYRKEPHHNETSYIRKVPHNETSVNGANNSSNMDPSAYPTGLLPSNPPVHPDTSTNSSEVQGHQGARPKTTSLETSTAPLRTPLPAYDKLHQHVSRNSQPVTINTNDFLGLSQMRKEVT